MNKQIKKILVVAAHPDDEVLGCGGTIARLIGEGHEVHSLILGEGITSRDGKRNSELRSEEIQQLNIEVKEANKVLGVKEVHRCDFPDNRFDSVDLLDIVKKIESVKADVKPDIVFTHYYNDTNIDHNITFNAVITATRPMTSETVKEIYSFEILSSTEWKFPITFSPDTFYNISDTIDKKINAMQMYKSELREFPHPRSLEGIRLNAKNWGMKIGVDYAEAFKCVRVVNR